MDAELAAIKAIDFNWVRPVRSIWNSSGQNVSALNGPVLADLAEEVFDGDKGPSPTLK